MHHLATQYAGVSGYLRDMIHFEEVGNTFASEFTFYAFEPGDNASSDLESDGVSKCEKNKSIT